MVFLPDEFRRAFSSAILFPKWDRSFGNPKYIYIYPTKLIKGKRKDILLPENRKSEAKSHEEKEKEIGEENK